jgi:predicted metal-binding membrane protein
MARLPSSLAKAQLHWRQLVGSLGRVRLRILAVLVALTGAAWCLTIYHALKMGMPMGIAVRGGMAADGMSGMAMSGMTGTTGFSFAGAVVFVALWIVMMAAMMLPAVTPMVLVFASAQARRRDDAAVPTWIFISGYMVVWAAAGLLVYVVVQLGSELATMLAPMERSRWAPIALGSTLLAAGLYQFTPIKNVCLSHCRSPLAFFAQHWRAGPVGALVMGLRHGGYCLGCCWALFAVMVAAGIMSLAWMLLLTLIVFTEKVLPQGWRAVPAIGIALILLGIVVAVGAFPMPWMV